MLIFRCVVHPPTPIHRLHRLHRTRQVRRAARIHLRRRGRQDRVSVRRHSAHGTLRRRHHGPQPQSLHRSRGGESIQVGALEAAADLGAGGEREGVLCRRVPPHGVRASDSGAGRGGGCEG